MVLPPWNKSNKKIPLRIVLVVPFVVQIMLIVGLVGYLSFRNGQQAVNNVAHQLRGEVTARIEEHLHTFLNGPHQINQINANSIRQGFLDVNNQAAMERYFWQQIQVFDSVTSIYFGNAEGGLVDGGREGVGGPLYVIATDGFVSGPFKKYATDSTGNRTELLATVPDFDARNRPWYTGAVQESGATWSDMYLLFTGQDMAISASRPVYDEQQNLLGVVSVDIFASALSDFLKNLEIGETGQSFIMERSGLLVASSTAEQPFTTPDGNEAQRRLYASESTVPTIRHAAEFLTQQFGNYHNISTKQQLEFEIDGQRQFLQIAPIYDDYGLEWLAVVVIPESDFMDQITANNRTTLILILVALIVAIFIGIITAQWVTKPILRLNSSTQALVEGEWQHVHNVGWISELDELTQSFNSMAQRLQQTLGNLTAEIRERKQTQEALENEREFTEAALDAQKDTFFVFDPATGRAIRWNQVFNEISGYSDEEIAAMKAPDDWCSEAELEKAAEVIQKLLRGEHAIVQLSLITKSGRTVPTEYSVSVIKDKDGQSRYAIAIGRDITERKRAEEEIKTALKEKESLLRELYHRTKNNMYVISAMLNLQSSYLKDEQALQMFQETDNKIQSMALVHEKLYQSQSLSYIDLEEYISDLTQLLTRSYNVIPDKIALILDLESVPVLIDTAIPCGLILNEILSNAFKHAFSDDRSGQIKIRLHRDDEMITLRIADNGIGIPPNFDLANNDSLGMKMILGIGQHQLQGDVTVETDNGVTWQIQFKDDLYNSRV